MAHEWIEPYPDGTAIHYRQSNGSAQVRIVAELCSVHGEVVATTEESFRMNAISFNREQILNQIRRKLGVL
ncbi:hypothetical protein COU80_02310 [Candidatus Peregrinibacteria bacterium CG10_big_fil_rev_8_21_14_0_10_55_24]|nr:MAG: hypothetical protein COU80_02310 [Candidatus Peregrinibacteria bacterium CG10_big_fil_rev_8_21_14_0_10_55_24]